MKLDLITNITGVIAAALVGPDGLAIEFSGDGGEILAAEVSALKENLERTSRRLGAGEVTRISFTSERVEVVAVASNQFILCAAMARGLDTRLAQQTLAKLALELSYLPHPEPA